MNRISFLAMAFTVSALGLLGCDDPNAGTGPRTTTPPTVKTDDMAKKADDVKEDIKKDAEEKKDAIDAKADETKKDIDTAKEEGEKKAEDLKDSVQEIGK